MPVRHPILERIDRLGLEEAAAKLIDSIVKEQGDFYVNLNETENGDN